MSKKEDITEKELIDKLYAILTKNTDSKRNSENIGSILREIDSHIEELRASHENQMDQMNTELSGKIQELRIAIVGNDMHKGIRTQVLDNKANIKKLLSSKNQASVKAGGIAGGVLGVVYGIIEVCKQIWP